MDFELHRPTSRVLDILETLALSERSMTLTELARAIDAPASSIMPFVRTLRAKGYVDMDPAGMTYSLGPKNLMLSAGYTASSDVYSQVLGEMQRVVDMCAETCQLGILDGNSVFYIGKIDSTEPLCLVSRVGKNLPASCTAIGKALMCDLNKEAIQDLYPDGLPSLTSSSLQDMDELYAQVLQVREGDFAMDVDESLEHLRCFALPMRFDGRVDAAVSVSTPDFRLNAEKKALVQQCLRQAQKAIEEHLRNAGHGLRRLA